MPKHFEMREQQVEELLRHHGAGELITFSGDVGLSATLLPFVYEPAKDGFGSLLGHLARNNDQWRQEPVGEAMVLLRGPDGYVTPTWYAATREHGRVVPTWNYETVHVFGQLVVRDELEYVRRVVELLTEKHEAGRDPAWAVADAPLDFIESQLRAIVGVELVITRIEGKAKLRQNRSAADVEGVTQGLIADGQAAMAHAVEREEHYRS